jgi:hypothetical protein
MMRRISQISLLNSIAFFKIHSFRILSLGRKTVIRLRLNIKKDWRLLFCQFTLDIKRFKVSLDNLICINSKKSIKFFQKQKVFSLKINSLERIILNSFTLLKEERKDNSNNNHNWIKD